LLVCLQGWVVPSSVRWKISLQATRFLENLREMGGQGGELWQNSND
jgi:hypothetical protein